jgi:spore coat polysaccharide biosynthesis protein SpsF
MEQLSFVPSDVKILACPEDCKQEFTPLAKRAGFVVETGPKEDVLGRFCKVIRQYWPTHTAASAARIIRATADNPFVFADAAIKLEEEARNLGADYACYAGIPHGSGTESLNAAALLAAEKLADPYEKEHVAPYLYHHSECFRLHRPLAPRCWQAPDLSLTVDTAEDFERAQILYRRLKNNENRMQGAAIIAAARECFGLK